MGCSSSPPSPRPVSVTWPWLTASQCTSSPPGAPHSKTPSWNSPPTASTTWPETPHDIRPHGGPATRPRRRRMDQAPVAPFHVLGAADRSCRRVRHRPAGLQRRRQPVDSCAARSAVPGGPHGRFLRRLLGRPAPLRGHRGAHYHGRVLQRADPDHVRRCPGQARGAGAKAAVVSAVTLAVGLVTALASFLAGQAILSRQHLGISLSHPGAERAVMAAALYLVAVI